MPLPFSPRSLFLFRKAKPEHLATWRAQHQQLAIWANLVKHSLYDDNKANARLTNSVQCISIGQGIRDRAGPKSRMVRLYNPENQGRVSTDCVLLCQKIFFGICRIVQFVGGGNGIGASRDGPVISDVIRSGGALNYSNQSRPASQAAMSKIKPSQPAENPRAAAC